MSDAYAVVFDAAQETPPLWFPGAGLLFVAVAFALRRFSDRLPAGHGPFRSPRAKRLLATVMLGFSVLWTAIAFTGVVGGSCAARSALKSGNTRVVEGLVEDFHPMPYNGHDTERFRVGDVHFAYSDYQLSSGFNQTSSHGGPVREALQVRIHYVGPPRDATILRLEVRQSP